MVMNVEPRGPGAKAGVTQTASTARLSHCGAFGGGVLSIRYGSLAQDAALDVRRRCSNRFCDWDCPGALVSPLYAVAIAAASGLSSPSPSPIAGYAVPQTPDYLTTLRTDPDPVSRN
jgi:hypothetical protein